MLRILNYEKIMLIKKQKISQKKALDKKLATKYP